MVAVGSDIVVFGGNTVLGEEARCACWPPSGGMSRLRRQLLRALLVCARGRMVSSGGAVPGGTRVWW